MLQVYITLSSFLKIWLTDSILIFREKLFGGTCLLASSNTTSQLFSDETKQPYWNGALETCKRNITFSWLSSLYDPFCFFLKMFPFDIFHDCLCLKVGLAVHNHAFLKWKDSSCGCKQTNAIRSCKNSFHLIKEKTWSQNKGIVYIKTYAVCGLLF